MQTLFIGLLGPMGYREIIFSISPLSTLLLLHLAKKDTHPKDVMVGDKQNMHIIQEHSLIYK